MKNLLLILLSSIAGYSQIPVQPPPPLCDHTSDRDSRFQKVRLAPPVTVTHITPTEVETVHQDRVGTYANTFTRDKGSILPKDFDMKAVKGKLFWVLYCECRHIYSLVELTPEQMRVIRR